MSKIDELEKLAKLKQNGVLTEKEFQLAKKEILTNFQEDNENNKQLIKKQKKPSAEVTDVYVWIVAVAPIALTILLYLVGITDEMWISWIIWFAFNTIFCALDDSQIQKAYKVPPDLWYLGVIPVYLYKRSNIVGDNKAYFWTWLGCCFLSFL